MPPAGHDGHDRAHVPALRGPEAHVPQPGPRPVREPRDEPLHPVLPLRALLRRRRRRRRPAAVRPAQHRVLRAGRRRGAGERVRGQPRRGLPDGRVHRQDAEAALHAEVGPADRAVGVPALRRRVQHDRGRALRVAAAGAQPLPPRRQRLLPLRPRALRLRVRERRRPAAPAAGAHVARGLPGGGRRGRRRGPRGGVRTRGRGGTRDRHRIAARVARGELDAARARGGGALLRRR